MKWRFFRYRDADAERVYRWHIEKRARSNAGMGLGMDGPSKARVDVYVMEADALYASMHKVGFWSHKPIPVDPDGEILGGAHRLACALALRIDAVPVEHLPQKAWAPAWDRQWFVDNGMSEEDLARTLSDRDEMCSN